jgi:alpha-mannosidase
MFGGTAWGQTMKAPDIAKEPTLFVVPYAHLDTQWRWEFPQTIGEYLLKTMRVNFYLIDKYPHYVFNFTGANRYRLMKEYYPGDYAKMKQEIAAGRWFPAGSSMEEGDVNLPSAESIIRQILYGNTYFRNEFGKASEEYMLPDCFGFPASLPSILAHAGIRGFSTQKLSSGWQPAPKVGGPDSPEQTPEGIPFNVGVWEGPDGKTVIAALNPESYTSRIYTDLSKAPPPPPANLNPNSPEARFFHSEQNWPARIDLDGKVTGVFADYHYIGTGDTGGAVNEESVRLLEATVTKGEAALPPPPTPRQFRQRSLDFREPPPAGPEVQMGDGPVHVISSTSDQMFRDIQPEMTSRMPRYKGDLELINHSAGSLTSEAYHKRWNRKNELLASAAEKASVAAAWLGGRMYPQQRLNNAWTLVMGGQFHDTAAGTATPRAYQFAWNDDVIAMNQFAGVLTDATSAVASAMNTQTRGIPVVVYNPLSFAREDIVEANVQFPNGTPKAVRVTGPDGKTVPAQLEGDRVVFVAKTPSTGYAVYSVQEASAPAARSTLKITPSSLENARYRVTVNKDGDVSSIFDKSLNKELLSAPVRLAISTDDPKQWPAWNMDFDDEQRAPRAYVGGPAEIRIKENGPARVSLEISRQAEGSKFVQTISLAAGGAGDHVVFGNAVDWRTLDANLKATFPLSASNEMARYNWDIGTIQRPNENERQFEVASHQWIDLTDRGGSYGTTILTDCKNGSDKPTDNTIRLTLMRSPGIRPSTNPRRPAGYTDQANQDWGHHEFVFGLAGHAGDWHAAQTERRGLRLNQPPIAFETEKHSGALGKQFSLLRIDNPHVRVMALKKAELSDEVILRMVETNGEAQPNVRVSFAAPIASAREVNGQEQPVGPATLANGSLETSFTPYQPRTFALKLAPPRAKVSPVESQPMTLSYDLAVSSDDDTKCAQGFDGKGDCMPAEMLPRELRFGGVRFQLAPAKTDSPNAVVAKGQTIDLPAGHFNRVYILAASADGDQKAAFKIGSEPVALNIEDWGGFIGQWDTRIWKNEPERNWAVSAYHQPWPPEHPQQGWSPRYPEDYVGLQPGYIKRADLAWYASHHHTPDGLNEPYQYSYLFVYAVDLPANTKTLTLPDNGNVKVLAVSVAEQNPELHPVEALYDTLGRSEPPEGVVAER